MTVATGGSPVRAVAGLYEAGLIEASYSARLYAMV
jgi:hypothetical protein